MNAEIVWVGIDVSQATLDVAIYPKGNYLQVSNNEAGVCELLKILEGFSCQQVVLEPTGGLERLVFSQLCQAGLSVARVNPRRVRAFATAMGLAKTDKLDAEVLAHFASTLKPRSEMMPEENIQILKDLVTRRHQLVKIQGSEKSRLTRVSETIRPSLESHIEQLKVFIDAINAEILQVSQQIRDWQIKREILLSVPGIGPTTCAVCLADLPELGTISDKKIARLVGVAPMNQDSGKHKGKRRIEGGRGQVRTALYMATLVATRHNPVIREFYQRLLERGKLKKVALTACLHKLLTILNAMMREMKTWQPPVQSTTDQS